MRLARRLLMVLIVLAAVAGGAVLGLRAGSAKVGGLAVLKPNLVTVLNAGSIGLFAARIADGPNVILFDTGLDAKGRPIDALLAALNAKREDVSDVFLTHGHFDHIAGVPALPKARIYLGAADLPLATGQAAPEAFLPMVLTKIMGPAPIAVNVPLTGAGELPVGPPKAPGKIKLIKAYPVPGHTPGSFAYLYDGVLFVGDIMSFKQGRLDTPPRIFDPQPEANRASIRSLKTQLANETIEAVCTAHGGCTPKGLGRNLLDDLISRVGG